MDFKNLTVYRKYSPPRMQLSTLSQCALTIMDAYLFLLDEKIVPGKFGLRQKSG